VGPIVPRPERPRFGALIHAPGGSGAGLDVDVHLRVARTLEDAGFAALLVHHGAHLEPITLLAAVSQRTTHLGLVATVTTSVNEPYNVARKLASLDHISGGRAGWNLADAGNFERATEFVDVVKGLWDSYAEGALIRDNVSGVYFKRDGRRAIDHHGKDFRVAGPLNLARPPQGHPVLFRDAEPEAGRAFAARVGEVVRTAPAGVAEAVEYRRRLDAAVTAAGRDPADVRVWAALTPVDAGTDRSRSRRDERAGVPLSARSSIAGSPSRVADRIEALWRSGAVDGFTVSFPSLPEQVDRFTAEVLPILAERGVFRPAEGATLRERLGLPVPQPLLRESAPREMS
jgi:alkanesulfonate monooxygenase SsuD/methylene tetrahydromethanopterin reductase-like flavin-dependent oxidoreductase (luciferase family)